MGCIQILRLLARCTRRHSSWVLCSVLAMNVWGAPLQAEPFKLPLNDQTISDKIEDELWLDPGVMAAEVDVGVTNGIVTLQGDVNNILAKQRAAALAMTVKGVRAVSNQIRVRPSESRADAVVRRDVQAALNADPAADVYEVVVEVKDGVVMLSGTVDSFQERSLAERVVKGVRGVTDLVNEIQVDIKSERPDKEIASEVREVLKWNRFIDDNLISVSVEDGKVTLSGIVGSAAEKRQARYVSWVAGVSAVEDSELEVERWARDEKLRGDKFAIKSPNEISDAITDALLYDPRVASFNVDVEVLGSTVTLRGDVDSLQAKQAAESVAQHAVGVTRVSNRIKVKPKYAVSDSDVTARVRDAMERDPYVERFEITPSVISGTAYLYGIVDSNFEKNRAALVAAGVKGVKNVNNYLRVDNTTAYVYDPFVDEDYFDSAKLMTNYELRAPGKTDAQLKDDIESELWWSPYVNANQVSVEVDRGIATLTGNVNSWMEYQTATENAYEAGATLVDNDIQVTYDE